MSDLDHRSPHEGAGPDGGREPVDGPDGGREPVDGPDGAGSPKPSTPPRRRRGWGVVRWSTRLVLGLIALVGILLLSVIGLVSSESGSRLLIERAVPIANKVLPGRIELGGFEGSLARHLVLLDVQVFDERDALAVAVKKVDITWNIWDLAGLRVGVQSALIESPDVYVRIREDGTVNFVTAFVKPSSEPKPEKEGGGGNPIAIDVTRAVLTGGRVTVELPGGKPLLFEGVELDAGYRMSGSRMDIQLGRAAVVVKAPVDIPEAVVSGAAVIDGGRLDASGLRVDWQQTAVQIDGGMNFSPLSFDLAARIERFELDDLKAFAEAIPLKSSIEGELTAKGPLSDLQVAGRLQTPDGGAIEIASGGVGLGDPLKHHAQLSLVGFTIDELLGTGAIPRELTGDIGWDGQGTGLDTLQGDATVRLEPLEYEGLRLTSVALDARLQDKKVKTSRLEVGLADGLVAGEAAVDLAESAFSASLNGDLPRLAALKEISRGAVQSGSATFDVRASGGWAKPITLRSDGQLSGLGLVLPGVALGGATAGWDIALELGKGLPSVVGAATVNASGVVAGGQEQARTARVVADLQGKAAGFEVVASRDPAVELELDGHADWSAVPDITIRGDRLKATIAEVPIQTSDGKPFLVRLESGAVVLEDLSLTLDGAPLLAQGRFDPKGAVGADVRLRSFDLAMIDRVLPSFVADKKVGVTGRIKELRLDLEGTLAEPTIAVSVSGRDVVVAERPPLNLDVALRSGDGLVSGTASLDRFANLAVGSLPLVLRLDGKGRPATLLPDGVWDVQLDLPQTALSDLQDLAGIKLPAVIAGGALAGGAKVTGTSASPLVDAALSLSDVTLADRRVNARAVARINEEGLSLDGSQVRTASDGTILVLKGGGTSYLGDVLLDVLGPADRPRSGRKVPFADLRVVADARDLPMGLLHVLAPVLKPLTGNVQAKVELGGNLEDPEVTVAGRLVNGRVRETELKSASTRVQLAGGLVAGTLEIEAAAGGVLTGTLGVSVPVAIPLPPKEQLLGQPDLTVRFDGRDFPVAVLTAFVPGVTQTRGTLAVDGGVTGSILAPQPAVHVFSEDTGLCYESTRICYREVHLDASVTPGGLELARVSALAEPQVRNPLDRVSKPVNAGQYGPVELSGRVSAQLARTGLELGEVSLDLEVGTPHADPLKRRSFWLSYTDDIKGQLYGSATVRGTVPALTVVGDFDINNVDVDMGQKEVSRKVAPTMLPTNLRVHRDQSRAGPGEQKLASQLAAEANKKPSLATKILRESTIDVDLSLTNNNKVKLALGLLGEGSGVGQAFNIIGNVAPDLVLQGDMHATIKAGKPLLTGRIETHRGSKLTVLTKKFDLVDGSGVDFTGAILNSQIDMRARHTTRYGDVFVVISGPLHTPVIAFESEDYPDQADIMSILVAGKPLDELTAAEGNATLSSIGTMLAGFGTKMAGGYVPLDTLAVDFGDDLSSGSVEAGKAITPRIFLITRFRWGAAADENSVEAEVQWQIDRRVYLEGLLGDKLKGGVDLVFKMQY